MTKACCRMLRLTLWLTAGAVIVNLNNSYTSDFQNGKKIEKNGPLQEKIRKGRATREARVENSLPSTRNSKWFFKKNGEIAYIVSPRFYEDGTEVQERNLTYCNGVYYEGYGTKNVRKSSSKI